jgi:carbohydrate kinase (thermoresistant glucokinase family)
MVIILMGVTASGKTTVGRLLASALGYHFYDADDFHPPSNIDKMWRGIPLTTLTAYHGWRLCATRVPLCAEHTAAVLTCSALKEAYQHVLLVDPQVRLVYLKA